MKNSAYAHVLYEEARCVYRSILQEREQPCALVRLEGSIRNRAVHLLSDEPEKYLVL